MASWEFVKKIGKIVSKCDLQEMNRLIKDEPDEFNAFLLFNEIDINDWIDHLLEAYSEGGLVAAS